MKIGALSLFQKTNCPKDYVIAAWHWRRSITWSWALYFALATQRNRMPHWRIFSRHHRSWTFSIPRCFSLSWASQAPMWM